MIQLPYGLSHGFIPPPRVTLKSQVFLLDFRALMIGGIPSSRLSHLNTYNVALESVLSSPITNMATPSFRQ